MALEVISISKGFNGKEVLTNLSFSIMDNERVGLIGRNGEGKTTLARILTGAIGMDKGAILFNGESIYNSKGQYKKELHKRLQLVPQQPYLYFDPMKTVEYSLYEPLLVHRLYKKTEIKDFLYSLADSVGLPKELLSRKPRELSGGELQRIALIRAISLKPDLLILDEATSMLDSKSQEMAMKMLMNQKNLSMLIISHDKTLLASHCNRLLVLEWGSIR